MQNSATAPKAKTDANNGLNNHFESEVKCANTDFFTQLKSMPLAKLALVINSNKEKGCTIVKELLDKSNLDLDFLNTIVVGAINNDVYKFLLDKQKTVKKLSLMAQKNESCAFFLHSIFLNSSFYANFHSNLYFLPTQYHCKKHKVNAVREFLCTNAINNRALVIYYNDKVSLDINLLKKVVACRAAGFLITDINAFVEIVNELRTQAAANKLKHKHSVITM